MDTFRNIKSSATDMKNLFMARDETEKRVFEALANVNWGASVSLLNEISRDTFDYEKYPRIMKIIWSSLDDSTNWRSVFKGLTLLDYLLKNGNERVIEECRDHMYKIRTLEDFNFFENTIDRGVGVREKAKQLRSLITNNEQIREERQKAREIREKLATVSSGNVAPMSGFGNGSHSNASSNFSGFGNSNYENHSSPYANSDMGSSSHNDNRGYGRYSDENSNREKQSSFDHNRIETGRQFTDDSRNRSTSPSKVAPKKIEVKLRDKPRTSTSTATASTSISSPISNPKAVSTSKVIQNQPDLLSTDTFVPPPPPSFNFDPFSNSTGSNNNNNNNTTTMSGGFDAFDPATQTTKNMSLDLFSVQPPSNQFSFSSFEPFQSATTNKQNFGFTANFGNNSFQSQTNQLPHNLFSQVPNQTQSFSNKMTSSGILNQNSDFGDFQSSSNQFQPFQQQQPIQQQQPQKKDNLGSLVNLNGLELNKSKDSKFGQISNTNKPDYSNHASFHGLDGFTQKSTMMTSGQSYNYGNYSIGQQSSGINRTQIPMGQLSSSSIPNQQSTNNNTMMGGKNPNTSIGSQPFNPFPVGGNNNNTSSTFNPFQPQTTTTTQQSNNNFLFPQQTNFGF